MTNNYLASEVLDVFFFLETIELSRMATPQASIRESKSIVNLRHYENAHFMDIF